MTKLNENYLKLQSSYLFSTIAKKVAAYKQENPSAEIIRLGIGDVTLPLPSAVIEAMHKAVDEMAVSSSFKGYGPDYGYDFLRQKIVETDYLARGVQITEDEVFISDGAKSDVGNFQEIFDAKASVAITDPVYPVYLDTNVMAGRTGAFKKGKYSKIVYLPCTAKNNFIPLLPKKHVDLIYICSPNNPTGTCLNKEELSKWVEYALNNKSVILFDSAYEAFISEPDIPHSIFEIPGAEKVAVEFRSFSKTAGFTGTRCAYTVVPKALKVFDKEGGEHSLNSLWGRRQSTKFNGVPYIVQKGAEAVYSPEGQKQIKENIAYYMENAKIIREGLRSLGLKIFGGVNAPYIWIKLPKGVTSWDFFGKLLKEANVVGTPGAGFGPCGEGCFRLTAFGSRENTIKAVERIKQLKL
ncbi:LL-diaminopimelate aminotransferase [Elusimicrobium minutum Pei191]|uniref:LL-diaminopimelate aminotransferase n=1 Tax=Elusimicrobium minutum (strain Pei191) TaxID=445932 RepID=B2KDH1_ELUMP|nr:LL-diaminopimelate aminotransferase [Elusimicrobium minutum]ACC98567.1 LL-diaminopimelate aminotransferase [Elusimicrobium minutum Pei191]